MKTNLEKFELYLKQEVFPYCPVIARKVFVYNKCIQKKESTFSNKILNLPKHKSIAKNQVLFYKPIIKLQNSVILEEK